MTRFGLAVPSLVSQMCPELRTAIALRAVSRYLQYVITDGVICTLVLCDRKLVPKRVLDNCAAKLPGLVREAVVFAEMAVPALVATLESFAASLCPHVRYFADEEVVLKQIELTFQLLSHLHCKDCLRGRSRLRRMAACNDRVKSALDACVAR